MPDAKPMVARQGSMVRRSTTSRRTEAKIGNPRIARPRILKPAGTHGSRNWRKSSGTRLIDRKRSGGSTFRSRTARKCDLWGSPQPHRTALQSRQPLGSAEVTHPFHPLCGHRFVVLKVRRVSGVETLSLRHADLGSFALPREWTDWAPPGTQSAPTGVQPLLVDAFGLLGLVELVTRLTRNDGA